MRSGLIRWFERNRRSLPWRKEPRKAYHVWVSEVMLQQTQVSAVVPYFKQWIRLFPTIRDLAAAPADDVLKAWEGLGYYRRARALHEAAGIIVQRCGGRMPRTGSGLRNLPGIGSYTAAAIASLAFGEDALCVDGNVKRVAARVFAINGKVTEKAAREKLEPLLPKGRAGLFNEALMELGATCCTPRNPSCGSCPVKSSCRALLAGRVRELPAPGPRKRAPLVKAEAFILVRGRSFYLRKRRDDEMLGGLWGFPLSKGKSVRGAGGRKLREVRHTYSHFTISVVPRVLQENSPAFRKLTGEGQGTFVTHERAAGLALSRLDRKILDAWKEGA
ncbi:MAG: A/G-specific adenine glycosylase [Pseudomonadota bacterium]